MELYLIRHADALALGERGITQDAGRPLSELGENQAAQVARILQKRGVALDEVITSPLIRAKQTAEIMLRSWNGAAPSLLVCEDLAPDAKPRKLARFLRGLAAERVAAVGHLPHIAECLAWLIGSKKAQIDMAKAGVAHISLGSAPRKGMGTLQWLVSPEWYDF